MSTIMIVSTVLITLALVFYSLGVWAERISRYLKAWHVVAFWTGFAFDVAGTIAMHIMAGGFFDVRDPHTMAGQVALWGMLVHAIYATTAVKKDKEEIRKKFHKYSIIIWLIWLVPYFSGMIIGMSGN